MALVQAKCTNCGANLEVDNSKDAAICQACGTPFIVEKAINNYNITNNIKADVVNVYGGNSADFVITAGKLIKYNGASTTVVIPTSVKEIGCEAFSECNNMTCVTIPDSVTNIGERAFIRCTGLINIIIPDSVTNIGKVAFYGCTGLTNIIIPNSVTNIDEEAFCGCEGLININIPKSLSRICRHTFSRCIGLNQVIIPKNIKKLMILLFMNVI